jgi:putative membrane protein
LLPGVELDNALSAVLLALVLSLLNALVKPFLILLTLPVTLLTLGLFLLAINAMIILLADELVPGFSVQGFWWAMFFGMILSFITSILESLAVPPEAD